MQSTKTTERLKFCNMGASVTLSRFGLEEVLLESCAALGIKEPTEIQRGMLEKLERKKDVLGVSGTGTGKTMAYALPILHHLLRADKYFYALVLLPTRELSQQVHSVFTEVGKSISLRTSLLIGGADLVLQGKSLAARPHIIIGTPGRVLYHLKNTKGIFLDSFRYLVLDECDRLLDGDFEGEVKEILETVGPNRNTLLFTATVTKRVAALKEKILNSPVVLESESSEGVPEALVQNYMYIPHRYKEAYLYELLRKIGTTKALVFVATCVTAEKIERILKKLGESVCTIHGNKPQVERTQVIDQFRRGNRNILIATDVASRGIDIPDIKMIVNYDIPEYSKDYVHRVGRTARAGKSGIAINFVTQYDVETFQKMEARIGVRMKEYAVEKSAIESLMDTVADAKREAEAEMREEGVGKRIKEIKNKKAKNSSSKKPRILPGR